MINMKPYIIFMTILALLLAGMVVGVESNRNKTKQAEAQQPVQPIEHAPQKEEVVPQQDCLTHINNMKLDAASTIYLLKDPRYVDRDVYIVQDRYSGRPGISIFVVDNANNKTKGDI